MIFRLRDIVFSALFLIILSPIITVIYLISIYKIGIPVFFSQSRPGYNGKLFNLYKFRTMLNKKDLNGKLLEDNKRLTPYGAFLRKLSLDELPSLYNVLKGDLSLVGPRPLLKEYLQLYNEHQLKRHNVKPGITGWVQVNGRNSLSWNEKFKLDLWYIKNRTFLLDLKIIIKTIWIVLIQKGISHPESVTMPKFEGNKN